MGSDSQNFQEIIFEFMSIWSFGNALEGSTWVVFYNSEQSGMRWD